MKTMTFEQPIPGREVYINRESGTVIGDGTAFTREELVLLHGGLVEQKAPSRHTADEIAEMSAAEAGVERCSAVRDAALKCYFEGRAQLSRMTFKTNVSGDIVYDDLVALEAARAKVQDAWRVVEAASEEEEAARVRWTKTCLKARDAALVREAAAAAASSAALKDLPLFEERPHITERARTALRALAAKVLT